MPQPKLSRVQSHIVDCKRNALKKCYFDLQQGRVVRSKVDDGKQSKKRFSMQKEFEKENSEINS